MASITNQFPGVTREALLRRNLQRHARMPVAIVLICVVVTAISIPYLHLDAQVNNMAYDIVELSAKRAALKIQVAELERQLAEAQSVGNMVKGAEAIGLRRSVTVQVLPVDLDQAAPAETSPLGALANSLEQLRASLRAGR